jgi:hypothetical protein
MKNLSVFRDMAETIEQFDRIEYWNATPGRGYKEGIANQI